MSPVQLFNLLEVGDEIALVNGAVEIIAHVGEEKALTNLGTVIKPDDFARGVSLTGARHEFFTHAKHVQLILSAPIIVF